MRTARDIQAEIVKLEVGAAHCHTEQARRFRQEKANALREELRLQQLYEWAGMPLAEDDSEPIVAPESDRPPTPARQWEDTVQAMRRTGTYQGHWPVANDSPGLRFTESPRRRQKTPRQRQKTPHTSPSCHFCGSEFFESPDWEADAWACDEDCNDHPEGLFFCSQGCRDAFHGHLPMPMLAPQSLPESDSHWLGRLVTIVGMPFVLAHRAMPANTPEVVRMAVHAVIFGCLMSGLVNLLLALMHGS